MNNKVKKFTLNSTVAITAFIASNAYAAPIIEAGSVNIFRTINGANNAGVQAGDRVQFGANIVGGSSGTTLVATYPGSSFSDTTVCSPLAVSTNFCSGSATYNASRLGAYTLTFSRAGESTSVVSPTLAGSQNAVPFAGSFTFSNATTTPTLNWTIPTSVFVDGLRLNIFDEDTIRPDRTNAADVIHSVAVSEFATSYVLPSILTSGQSLNIGGRYAVSLQIIETRSRAAFTGNNAEILSRTQSFYDFTPTSLAGITPPTSNVPVPGSLALALVGLLGIIGLRKTTTTKMNVS